MSDITLIIYKNIWSFHFIYVILLHIIMTYRLLLLLLPLLFMTSCQDGRWHLFGLSAEEEEQVRLSLSLADSLMEDNPDSAMAVLRRDSALVLRADINERMMYALLKTQADDKLYVTHRSDSVIRKVAEYYNEHGDARQQTQAWYLLGRVSYDLNHTSSALSAWKKALAVEKETPVVNLYKAKTASWIGAIYEEKGMYNDLLKNKRQEYEYAKKSDITEQVVFALRDIGRSYKYVGDTIKSIEYYKEAIMQAEKLNNPKLRYMVEGELATIYIKRRMFDKAHNILMRPIEDIYEEDIAAYLCTLGTYYEAKGDVDSAAYFYNKSITQAALEAKVTTAGRLAALYDKTDNHSEAHKYRELVKLYNDSLKLKKQTETQDNIKNIEEKAQIQAHTESVERTRMLIAIVFCVVIVLVMFVLIIMIKRNKRQTDKLVMENRRNGGYWKHKHEQDTEKLEQAKGEISVLRQEKERLMNQKKDETEAKKNTYEEKALQEDNLKATRIYKLFHISTFQPKEEDYIQLEKELNATYDNFTVRLKDMYPRLNKNEIRICCLLKIELSIKEIGILLGSTSSRLSMVRKRLYEKCFSKDGKASDFDDFIRRF